jgi:hypothetical protein
MKGPAPEAQRTGVRISTTSTSLDDDSQGCERVLWIVCVKHTTDRKASLKVRSL